VRDSNRGGGFAGRTERSSEVRLGPSRIRKCPLASAEVRPESAGFGGVAVSTLPSSAVVNRAACVIKIGGSNPLGVANHLRHYLRKGDTHGAGHGGA
jgi:hypothetical protein